MLAEILLMTALPAAPSPAPSAIEARIAERLRAFPVWKRVSALTEMASPVSR